MKSLKKTFFLLFISAAAIAQEANDYFDALTYRNIGPYRGGRSVTASGVVDNPLIYYMGTTGGGLWKTEDAGVRWNNISDGFFKTGSVGAVAVSESNPNILYCGMGEHAIRGVMTSYGDGVYKSYNAGNTWEHIGLPATQQISRIVIHPTNPDIVYVAAQGKYTGPTSDRGVYKSIDGGENWKKVLYKNQWSGAVELSLDMNNPNVLYAALWHHQRTPWQMISGGEGSGLYKSTDAGETWEEMTEGLPEAMGKMAISVCRSNPSKVYALIESDSYTDDSGLYVSNNAGASWKQVSGDNRLTQRAWYYTEVFTDPGDDETIYVLSAPALRSKDGGSTWERITGTHGDYHDLWINPTNSNNMVIANDGGAAVSFNAGETWSSQDGMPTAQFYRINTDNLFPYNIYGGQQDNTSVKIASMSLGRGSISQSDWTAAAGGESAFLAFDKNNPSHTVGGSYLGTIEVLDMENKTSVQIMAKPYQYLGRAARDMDYLYNWNAPIVWSQHEPNTIYHAAQLVLKSTDMGQTWTEFSPDLTRNIDEKQGNGGAPYTNEAVGAENYGTIAYLVESQHEKGVFYSGSDDGKIYITKNNGTSWEDITPKNLGETLVNAIDISPHDPATAYVATTKYKLGDYTPALFKTTNYGKSWTKISNGIPQGAHSRVVREDQNKKGVLYAGTELGIYISFNDGNNWEPLQLNMPVTPILDLKVHQNDLIVATSGRSFWILDDINVFSQYDKNSSAPTLFTPEPKVHGTWYSAMDGDTSGFNGQQEFEGVNPASGVVLYYHLPSVDKTTSLQLTIKDSKGNMVNSYSNTADTTYIPHNGGGAPPAPVIPVKEGLNRFVWDTEYPIIPGVPAVYIEAGFNGHKAIPGRYTAVLSINGKEVTAPIMIKKNQRYEVTDVAFNTYHEFMMEAEQVATDMHLKVNNLHKVQQQITQLMVLLEKDQTNDALLKKGNELLQALKNWDATMVQRRSQAYDDVENFVNGFSAEYLFMLNQTSNDLGRVNASNKERKRELDLKWQPLKEQAERLMNIEIPAFNNMLWDAGIGAIKM